MNISEKTTLDSKATHACAKTNVLGWAIRRRLAQTARRVRYRRRRRDSREPSEGYGEAKEGCVLNDMKAVKVVKRWAAQAL